MPVMDGYEATRRIREAESRYGVHTPIIALTAHAMEDEGQQQKTIAAGMDLHLTKPMERRSIAEAIRRVCVVGQD
jgi:CheY-like chemotaxis protein